MFRVWGVCSYRFHIIEVHAHTKTVRIDNATAVAVGVLCAASMKPGPLLDSFLKAGGIPAVVRLLRKSTCPAVLVYTATLIGRMLESTGTDRSIMELSEQFHQAGECRGRSQGQTVNCHWQGCYTLCCLVFN
jgi:hypothetical protein